MHVPVRVWKDGVSRDLRLYNTQQDQEFVISEDRVDSVQFDPMQWLCAKADKITAVQQLTKPALIQIIPDYSVKKLHVILPDYSGKESLRIIDVNGRIIRSSLLNGKDSWIDITDLRNGIYLVEVQSKGQNKSEKIIIWK